jgi:SAM-dependent methyltransferase
VTTAADRWAAELAAWRIDDEILAAAPESPYVFPPELFAPGYDVGHSTPSQQRAREVLPEGGTVLDVGCGGGAAALALVPPAGRLVGVDVQADMLELFAEGADERGVDHVEIEGRWPDVATDVPDADVVVAHHVAYNVAALAEFARALDQHADRRVVLELTAVHPWVPVGPLWEHFHGQRRPHGPTAQLAAEALREAGLSVHVEEWERTEGRRDVPRAARVAFMRRRLCLPASRDAEVDALLGADAELRVRAVVTLWWDA